MTNFVLGCLAFFAASSAVAADVNIHNSNHYDIDIVIYRDVVDCALMSGDGSNCQAWNHLWQMEAWRTIRPGQSIRLTTNQYSCVGAVRNGQDLVQANLDAGNLYTGELNYVFAATGSISTVQFLALDNQNSRLRVHVRVGDRRSSRDMAASDLAQHLASQGMRRFRCLQSYGDVGMSF